MTGKRPTNAAGHDSTASLFSQGALLARAAIVALSMARPNKYSCLSAWTFMNAAAHKG